MQWLSRIQIIVGVWILISPWILGFSDVAPALWSSVIAGAITSLIGFWHLFGEDTEEIK